MLNKLFLRLTNLVPREPTLLVVDRPVVRLAVAVDTLEITKGPASLLRYLAAWNCLVGTKDRIDLLSGLYFIGRHGEGSGEVVAATRSEAVLSSVVVLSNVVP